MARYTIFVHVMPREGVLDPPGEATRAALQALGFQGVRDVRIGRRIAVEIEAGARDEAEALAASMAERLLANPVVESFELAPAGGSSDTGTPERSCGGVPAGRGPGR